ncbi:MAG: hypothetical protein ACK4NS_03580 [Saprospiraceae bacterium]
MNMIKIAALTLALIFTTNLIFAQGPAQNKAQRDAKRAEMETRRQERIDRLAAELNLSAEQKAAFNKAYDEEKAARMAEREANKAQAKARRQEAQNRLDERMKTILTPEQYAKWQQRGKRDEEGNKPQKGGKSSVKKEGTQNGNPKREMRRQGEKQ